MNPHNLLDLYAMGCLVSSCFILPGIEAMIARGYPRPLVLVLGVLGVLAFPLTCLYMVTLTARSDS